MLTNAPQTAPSDTHSASPQDPPIYAELAQTYLGTEPATNDDNEVIG